jgi:hypothetical protein
MGRRWMIHSGVEDRCFPVWSRVVIERNMKQAARMPHVDLAVVLAIDRPSRDTINIDAPHTHGGPVRLLYLAK